MHNCHTVLCNSEKSHEKRHGVGVNARVAINDVALRQAQLLLGRVTVCGQVNHLGM